MSPEDLQPYAPELPEPAAHMMPRDLERFAKQECVGQAYSVAVGGPDGRSEALFTEPQLRAILADAQAAIAARDARIVELERLLKESCERNFRATTELRADLREREERIASMRTEWAAEVAALTQRARSLDWNKEFEENVGRPPTDEDRKLMGVSE